MLEYEDDRCPKCGSEYTEMIDYFPIELLETFESVAFENRPYLPRLKKKVTKVYSCDVLLVCLECGHTWSCPGICSEEEEDDSI